MKHGLVLVLAVISLEALAESVNVDSPFALKLGDDEFAVRFPKTVTHSHSVSYDGHYREAKHAWTNWHWRASVSFVQPYHIFERAEVNFRETDKKLYSYSLHADCPETMTREECIKMLENVVADLNAYYGLKLKLQSRPLTKTEEEGIKGRRGHSTSFAHTSMSFDFLDREATNTVQASVYGMVNGKGGMSANVHVYDSDLQSDVYTRRGRFFESSKAVAGGCSEPPALPLGYRFGDVYTNSETVAIVPEGLTNWPAAFGWEGREVPLTGKWRDFDGALFRLSEYGRISSFAAVLSTNGIVSTEAMETWARGVLEAKRDELELSFIGGVSFYPLYGQTNDYRRAYASCHSRTMGMERLHVSTSAQVEAQRLDDGRAFLRISFSTDDAKKLDAPKRQADGDGVRRALKDLLDLDFKSEQSNQVGRAGLSDWQRLAVPKDMFTEWRPWFDVKTGRLRSVSLRYTYEGDVSKEALSNAVQRLVRSIEVAAGQKLGFCGGDIWSGLLSCKRRSGEMLSYGDYLGGVPPTCSMTAKVGDMSVEISYAVPQYVKEGNRYVQVMKGGIIFRASSETK